LRPTDNGGSKAGGAKFPGAVLSHRQIMIVYSGLMMGLLLAGLDQTVVATALPTIVGDLKGLDRLSWVVTAYLLTSTASTPLYGKISDLYGRRQVLQAAIIIFLVGSVLAGLSQNINELILTRGIQGIGAGGLITLAMAIVGDIVPPRQRGRYQGYFSAVFAATSVAGPLLGGFFVQDLSWRWIFYINLPIGAVALVMTSVVLRMDYPRREHRIDYLGSLLIVIGVSALLIVTVWGGNTYAWSSLQIVVTGTIGLVFCALFVWRETRAPEPLIPLRLFSNRVFSVCNSVGFIAGAAMFGVIVFLPLYLQLVKKLAPTVSGLLLVPMMVGILMSSIIVGRTISRIGRYRAFLITGTAVAICGLFALSHLGVHSNQVLMSASLLLLGSGIGMSMPVLTIAVQNAVDWRDMGIGTATVNFFRSLGNSFGTAVFGAILIDRFDANLAHTLPQHVLAHVPGGRTITGSPAAVHRLAPGVQAGIYDAFARSLDTVFLVATIVMVLAFVLSLFLRDVRLRDHLGDEHPAPSGRASSFLLEGGGEYDEFNGDRVEPDSPDRGSERVRPVPERAATRDETRDDQPAAGDQ
jgi:EmrB/QacA subfamily drug resistance transporter